MLNNYSSLTEAAKNAKLAAKQKDSVLNFAAIIELCQEMTDTDSPEKILSEVINQTNYYEYLEKENHDEAFERIADVKELLGIAQEYKTAAEFINSIMLNDESIELNDSDKSDKVSLLTMPASKGLEFPIIIIVGAAEGIVPSSRSVMEGNLQEERRLMYVALTRAKKKIFISYPKLTFNRGIPIVTKPSRFLSEIGGEFIANV